MQRLIWGAGVIAALALQGCGGSDDESGNSGGSSGTGASGGTAATGGGAGQASGGGGSGGNAGQASGGSAGQSSGGSAGQNTGGAAGASGGCTGTATYTVRFDALWSAATHPTEFPSSAHWSPLVGATHNATGSIWSPGSPASDGIEQMAETGGTTKLKSEIATGQGQGTMQHLLSGSGVNPSPGQTSFDFQIDPTHPLVTVVSMIAPSPDWFVGVHDLELCAKDGKWLPSTTVDLLPYDAGTDSGSTFTSSNADTQPPGAITAIVSAPLGNGSSVAKLGTFTFTKK